jgi:hypothetical protein
MIFVSLKSHKNNSPNETSPRLLVEITLLPGELPDAFKAAPAPAPSPSLEALAIDVLNL